MPTFDKKTPDVYIEEVSVFPPSVAEVETAIPAFIGYTESVEFRGKDLTNRPTRIKSLVEFTELYGGAPPVDITEVHLDAANNVTKSVIESNYLLYDSIRLFFMNGGGPCYVISVGTYDNDISLEGLRAGLGALQKEDEPTLIVFPDAVLMDGTDLYDLQKDALRQANTLQDRFVVMDCRENLTEAEMNDVGELDAWYAGIKHFRNNIGINYLKYGASYTPHLRANLSKTIRFRHLRGKIQKLGASTSLKAISGGGEIAEKVNNLELTIDDIQQVRDDIESSQIDTKYNEKVLEFRNAVATPGLDADTVRPVFLELFGIIYQAALDTVDDWGKENGALQHDDNVGVVRDVISSPLKPVFEKLNSYSEDLINRIGGAAEKLYEGRAFTAEQWDWADITTGLTETNIFHVANEDADDDVKFKKRMEVAEPKVTEVFESLRDSVRSVLDSLSTLETDIDEALVDDFPAYKSILAAISDELTTLPPSGAIVGVYSAVDADRGVWKAPANVSLSGVADLTKKIDNSDQEGLNVDVVAGKSVNAIRAFTGKGRLVWGARTLAGNDKEWRYIPVRRFFNMVEESVKKSTYWAVFEPNDANLWIKVKAMIENYLTLKWRDGALQGAAPQDAFFVNIGLGQTMTYQNILDGYLIVEIGMAVVRPAEFIVLRFSHKMVEA